MGSNTRLLDACGKLGLRSQYPVLNWTILPHQYEANLFLALQFKKCCLHGTITVSLLFANKFRASETKIDQKSTYCLFTREIKKIKCGVVQLIVVRKRLNKKRDRGSLPTVLYDQKTAVQPTTDFPNLGLLKLEALDCWSPVRRPTWDQGREIRKSACRPLLHQKRSQVWPSLSVRIAGLSL